MSSEHLRLTDQLAEAARDLLTRQDPSSSIEGLSATLVRLLDEERALTDDLIVSARGAADYTSKSYLQGDMNPLNAQSGYAKVDARLAIWPNQLHVFPLFAPILSEGRDGCIEIGNFIRSKTA